MTLLEFKMCLRHCSYCVGCCRERDKEVTMNITKFATLSNFPMCVPPRKDLCTERFQAGFGSYKFVVKWIECNNSVSVHESRKIKFL